LENKRKIHCNPDEFVIGKTTCTEIALKIPTAFCGAEIGTLPLFINTMMDFFKLNIIEALNCFSRLQGQKMTYLSYSVAVLPSLSLTMHIKSMPVFPVHV